jgi:hypothetical protein
MSRKFQIWVAKWTILSKNYYKKTPCRDQRGQNSKVIQFGSALVRYTNSRQNMDSTLTNPTSVNLLSKREEFQTYKDTILSVINCKISVT